MFTLKSTVIIILALLIPFLLKTIGLEPFPAVELPSGGMVVKEINNQVKFDYSVLFGLNSEGNWIEINQQLLISPIPVHYSSYLVNSNFGKDKATLRRNTRRYKLLKKIPYFNRYYDRLLYSQKTNLLDLKEREIWLKTKLHEQGLELAKLKVVTFTKTVSIKNKKILGNTKKNEKIINLAE